MKFLCNKKLLFGIILHLLHGFIFEKSKLYYPYTFGRNVLFIKTDLYKFYISICFISLGIPYILSKLMPEQYFATRASAVSRYKNHNTLDVQIGGYLLGISMLLTGFCPSYLPIYLAINPLLFLYGVIASYFACACYHIYERIVLHRTRPRPVDNEQKKTSKRGIAILARTKDSRLCYLPC
jgi:hypothetical protein